MPHYLISFDLKDRDKPEKKEAISHGDMIKFMNDPENFEQADYILNTVWAVDSNWTLSKIAREIQNKLDPDDKLIVAEYNPKYTYLSTDLNREETVPHMQEYINILKR